jgi:hypothetical protein
VTQTFQNVKSNIATCLRGWRLPSPTFMDVSLQRTEVRVRVCRWPLILPPSLLPLLSLPVPLILLPLLPLLPPSPPVSAGVPLLASGMWVTPTWVPSPVVVDLALTGPLPRSIRRLVVFLACPPGPAGIPSTGNPPQALTPLILAIAPRLIICSPVLPGLKYSAGRLTPQDGLGLLRQRRVFGPSHHGPLGPGASVVLPTPQPLCTPPVTWIAVLVSTLSVPFLMISGTVTTR